MIIIKIIKTERKMVLFPFSYIHKHNARITVVSSLISSEGKEKRTKEKEKGIYHYELSAIRHKSHGSSSYQAHGRCQSRKVIMGDTFYHFSLSADSFIFIFYVLSL
jgi:hypothetical protein